MRLNGSDRQLFRTIFVLRVTKTEPVVGPDGVQQVTREVEMTYHSDPMTLEELEAHREQLYKLPNLVSERQVAAGSADDKR